MQRRVLILVENLPSPFDRRVWQEATTLRDAGYGVSIVCPTGRGCEKKFEAIDGIDIWNDKKSLNKARRKFGVLFQSGALLNGLTCYDNVALPLRQLTDLDPETIDIMVRMKLELVGMGHAADRRPPEISGGMQKRCALARAIALDPAIVFFDEPSAGIDPVMISILDRLVLDLLPILHA